MLHQLRIRHFALIDALDIDIASGLTVLTGETGAGKSIVISALNLVLGERGQALLIRDGQEKASVEALFRVPSDHPLVSKLAELDLGSDSAGELLVRRVIARNEKSQTYVNDRRVTLTTLRQLTESLVDISSQHEHLSLRDRASHLSRLDAFGGAELLVEDYREHFETWRAHRDELAELQQRNLERLAQLEFLRFQHQELDAANLREGEEEELDRERKKLRNLSQMREASQRVVAELYSAQGAALERLDKALKSLEFLVRIDPALKEDLSTLNDARYFVEDLALRLRDGYDEIEDAESALDEIESRLAQLSGLKRRFGPTVESMIERRDTIAAELELLDNLDARIEQLTALEERSKRALITAGEQLSERRRAVARRFEHEIQLHLESLGMERARFVIAFEPIEPTPEGIDGVEFLLSANPGEKPQPLQRIASGGELSRFMLAIKQVLSQTDPVLLYVFDEVDTGIGGTTAEAVGRSIRQTAEAHQVLCITHLHQIARYADHHLVVEKGERAGRTISSVRALSHDERAEELARMLGGPTVSAETRQFARTLLETAH
ncbi:MAG: DNA repair protein RecN [Myxococcales bacterium]|nr:DNA repair protein RecN [Myxococcales bacterium]